MQKNFLNSSIISFLSVGLVKKMQMEATGCEIGTVGFVAFNFPAIAPLPFQLAVRGRNVYSSIRIYIWGVFLLIGNCKSYCAQKEMFARPVSCDTE